MSKSRLDSLGNAFD